MTASERQAELHARFDGAEDFEVEYVGRFRTSGNLTLRVVDDVIAEQWRLSVVPDEYMPLYGLKHGPAEYAGGLFDAAPFAAYDPDGPQYAGMNAPSPPESIYDLCTDNCGCPFWLSGAGIVYGHNLNNEIQCIGPLESFVDLVVSLALNDEPWYAHVNNNSTMKRFGLANISTMG